MNAWGTNAPRFCVVLLTTALVLAPREVWADHFDVFVLTGQSNSLGTTAGGEPNPLPEPDSADRDVRFFWSNVSTSSSDPDNIDLIGSSAGRVHDVAATARGRRVEHDLLGARDQLCTPRWRSQAGAWRSSRHPGQAAATATGSRTVATCMATIVETVRAATAILESEGHTFSLRGLLYLQGESDSSTDAAAAGTRLLALITNLRADLPEANEMLAVVGGIAASGSTRDVVRAEQEAAARTDPTVHYFSNTDLRASLYDGLHFDRAAKLVIGERYASFFPPPRTELQVPGDANQDSELDLSDAVAILSYLFLSADAPLPCEGDSVNSGGNRELLDLSADAEVDLSDAVYLLQFLFLGGATAGVGCRLRSRERLSLELRGLAAANPKWRVRFPYRIVHRSPVLSPREMASVWRRCDLPPIFPTSPGQIASCPRSSSASLLG